MALNFPDNPGIGSVFVDTNSGFSYKWDGTVWNGFTGRSASEITLLDDVSGSFDGIETTFALTKNTYPVYPIKPDQLRVVLGGVVQTPGIDYTLSNSNTDIVFTTAPIGGLTCAITEFGIALPIPVPADGTVTPEKLSTGGPEWNANGELYISGVTTTSNGLIVGVGLTLPDNVKLNAGNDNDLQIFHDGSNSIIDGAGTGSILLRTDTDIKFLKRTGSENILVGNADGSVAAYYNNVKRLETTDGGALVYGAVGAAQTALIVEGDARVTGILTVGQTSITLDGTSNTINVGTGVTIDGDAGSIDATNINVSGNVSIAGTLTYEDVNNIDSIGIITARSGVSIADSIFHTGDTDTAIRFPTDDTFTVETAGSERVRINSAGDSIFTGSVDIGNETAGRKTLTLNSQDNGAAVLFRADAGTRARVEVPDGETALIFGVELATTPTERMRIDNSGRLLLGTQTEGDSTADDLTIATTGHTGITLRGSTFDNCNIYFSDGTTGADEYRGIVRYAHSLDRMEFWSNSVRRVVIDSSGRLLLGTTSSSANTSLVLQGNAANTAANGTITLARGTSAPANGAALGEIDFSDNSHNTPAAWIYAARDGGTWTSGSSQPSALVFSTTADGASSPTERMRIKQDGSVDISTNDLTVYGVTVGRGSGAITSNTVVGSSALVSNTTGFNNVANGYQALYTNTTGNYNTANGYQALYTNTAGNNNTATGEISLFSNTTGSENTGYGVESLYSNTTGNYNTATGVSALRTNTTGSDNVAIGVGALRSNTGGYSNVANGKNALYTNTTGFQNTANGQDALYYNTTGNGHVANGYQALLNNTTGINNTATGVSALRTNTTGNYNTANGHNALYENTIGAQNTATGNGALANNTTGTKNTANGNGALFTNTTGTDNIATGAFALYNNTTANYNVANGNNALFTNTTGAQNTANGQDALYYNTEGTGNTADGYQALLNNTTGNYNTATGFASLYSNTTASENTAYGTNALYSNTTGTKNTAIGQNALYAATTGNYNVANGNLAMRSLTTGSGNFGAAFLTSSGTEAPVFNPTTHNNRICLGHTSISGAYVQVAWTVVSDQRDKMNFGTVPHGLDFIKQLNPVSFQFKVDRDTEEANGPVRYGFKAQDILALEGDDNAVIIDNEDPDKLRYNGEALVPVLVNAIKEQQTIIDTQQQQINDLLARLDAAGI